MQTVDSSLIAGWDYDPLLAKLTVKFKNGSTYHYYDVPPEVAEQLKSADSPGHFFARNIKGRFDFQKA